MTSDNKRPLDTLASFIGKKITVNFKKATKEPNIEGTLLAFDIHINLVIEQKKKSIFYPIFVRGDNILTIMEIIEDGG